MLAPRAVKRKVNAGKAASRPAEDALKSEGSSTSANQQYIDMLREEEEYHRQAAIDPSKFKVPNGGASSNANAKDEVQNEEDPAETARKQAEKLAALRLAIEETLSDWGLCHNRDLLKRLESRKTGCTPLASRTALRRQADTSHAQDVHISNLLAVSAISNVTTAMTDVTEALQAEPLENVEVCMKLIAHASAEPCSIVGRYRLPGQTSRAAKL